MSSELEALSASSCEREEVTMTSFSCLPLAANDCVDLLNRSSLVDKKQCEEGKGRMDAGEAVKWWSARVEYSFM